MTKYKKAVAARITGASLTQEDRGFHTVTVALELEHYSQCFGCLVMTEDQARAFAAGVCASFGVANLKQLVDMTCVALYTFGEHNEQIAALRGPYGVFSVENFLDAFTPDRLSPIERRRCELADEVASAERRLDDARARLRAFELERRR